jgi:hypothetical protein
LTDIFTRTSKKYFDKSKRFIYYRNDKPVYVYSNIDLTQKKMSRKIAIMLLILSILIICLPISILIVRSIFPKPIQGTEKYDIVINDDVGILKNRKELTEELKKFKEATGIVPAITTINNVKVLRGYKTIENFTYSLYMQNFIDEVHWLIVYSEANNEGEWEIAEIQGHDADSILTIKTVKKFENSLKSNLNAISGESKTDAFLNAFKELNNIVMKPSISIEYLVLLIGLILFIFFIIRGLNHYIGWFGVYKYSELKMAEEAEEITDDEKLEISD